jgi:hypothetical protein
MFIHRKPLFFMTTALLAKSPCPCTNLFADGRGNYSDCQGIGLVMRETAERQIEVNVGQQLAPLDREPEAALEAKRSIDRIPTAAKSVFAEAAFACSIWHGSGSLRHERPIVVFLPMRSVDFRRMLHASSECGMWNAEFRVADSLPEP